MTEQDEELSHIPEMGAKPTICRKVVNKGSEPYIKDGASPFWIFSHQL